MDEILKRKDFDMNEFFVIPTINEKNNENDKNKERTSEPFELVHMDTVVISNKSIYGNKYFVSILDDNTRFGLILFIKSKADIFNAFHSW